jgi:hypothetical protein
MGGGGKGGSSGPPVTPTYTDPISGRSYGSSAELNDSITARQAQEKTASDAAAAAATAKAAQDEADFQTRATGAKTQASTNINDYFSSQGVDPNKYASQIANAVNTASNNVIDLDPNPQGKYASTLGSDLYNTLTSGQQSQNLANYNAVFDPSYSLTALPGTLIDPSVTSVINSQFDPLDAQLTNAQKRGTLNDQGYAAALQALKTSKTGATSTVNKLAQGVLDSDRSGVNDYIGTGRTAAGSAPLNTAFSVDPYKAGAADLVSRDTASFGGDVQNAVGATKFSDLTTLLNAGGSAQGAYDPTATNPNGAPGPNGAAVGGGDLSPAYLAQQALAKDPRGLGTTGAF